VSSGPPTDRDPDAFVVGGTIAHRYRVESVLGSGGFGVVYGAVDVHDGTRAAVKVLSRKVMGMSGGPERFKREAELARRIDHPSAVRVLSSGSDWSTGALFIAFELLEGLSIEDEILKRGRIAPTRVATVVLEVLKALEHAHALGIVHRDIKPANVFSMADGRVKVLDFGIAKSLNPGTLAGLTQAGMAVGTPAYMPREQLLGQPLGPSTDLFALGVLMIEMLGGRPLYGSERSVMDVVKLRIEALPFELPQWLPPSFLTPVIERATRVEPAARFQSAGEMSRAIRGALEAPAVPSWTSSTMRSAGSGGAAPGMPPVHGPPTRPLAPHSPLVAGRPAAGKPPWALIAGLFVLVAAGLGVALYVSAGTSKRPASRDDDREEQPKKRKKKRVVEEPEDEPETPTVEPPPPTPPPLPPPTPTPPPTPPSSARVRVCSKLLSSQAQVRPRVEELGWRVSGTAIYCAGSMVNFRCLGPEGRGHTYERGSESGSVVGMKHPSAAAAEAYAREAKAGTIAREGATVLIVDLPDADADRLLAKVCTP
jgi:serine/threonine-protein kinase